MLTHGDTRCFCHGSNYTKMNILNYLCFCHWFCKMKWLVSRLDMICIKLDYLEAFLKRKRKKEKKIIIINSLMMRLFKYMIISQFVNNEVSGNSLCLCLVSYILFCSQPIPSPKKGKIHSLYYECENTPPFFCPKNKQKEGRT